MDGYTYNKNSVLEKYDDAPTSNSTNLVDSGHIKTYVDSADATIDAKVDQMIDRVGNPFVFKGTVAATSNLPSSGNTVNDTYFVEGEGFMYTWNGTAWDKSSTDVNNQLAHDIATEYSETKADYKAGDIVMYNNQVYVRKSDAIAAEGTFVSANWTATSLGDELSEEITNLKSALNVVGDVVDKNLLSYATLMDNRYIPNVGNVAESNNWRSYKFDVNVVKYFTEIKCYTGGTTNSNIISFYNDETPGPETFIGGVPAQTINSLNSISQIVIPSNAVIAIVSNRKSNGDPEIFGVTNDVSLEATTIKANKSQISAIAYVNGKSITWVNNSYCDLLITDTVNLKCGYGDKTLSVSDLLTLANDSSLVNVRSDNSIRGFDFALVYDVKTSEFKFVSCQGGSNYDNCIILFAHYYNNVNQGLLVDSMNPYQFDDIEESIDSLSTSKFITNDEIMSLLPDLAVTNLSINITEDTYTHEKKANITNEVGGSLTTGYMYFPVIPCKAVILEFFGVSTANEYSENSGDSTTIVVEFFTKNKGKIGSKYNSSVLGETNMGYHRYGFVSPYGAKYLSIRFAIRGQATMTVSNISLKIVDAYPQRLRNGILIDGHLGMTFVSPRNTMPSFTLGKIAGFDTMITNVNVTSDGVLVALHDDTIDATSDGSGNVKSYTWSELQTFDFGSYFHDVYTGTRIPKFETVVKFMSISGIKLAVSIHGNLTDNDIINMCNIITKYGAENCLIKSFYISDLQKVYNILGNRAEYAYSPASGVHSQTTIDAFDSFPANNKIYEFTNIPVTELVAYAKQKNMQCSYFPANDILLVKKCIETGISRLTTDTFSDIVFPMD